MTPAAELVPATEEAYHSETGDLFIWADEAQIREGVLEFRSEAGVLQAAVAPGRWYAVYQATPDDDAPLAVETR